VATGSQSWSQPAEPARAAVAAAFAIVVFMASWTFLHHGFWNRSQIIDTPIYLDYGNKIAAGKLPYRDFPVEYPPGSLPVFALPALGHSPSSFYGYRRVFETLMWLCGALALLFMAIALRALGAGPRRSATALGFAALAPLAIGSVILSRFDLVPAMICVGALAALVAGRTRVGLGVLGLGVATKLWPGVVAPLAFAYVWRREGRREALVCGGIFVAVMLAVFLPFAVLAPDGVRHSFTTQATRPLQIESLGSAFLLAAHQLFGLGIRMYSSHGSQNLGGGGAPVIAPIVAGIQLATLVGLWIGYARHDDAGEPERLLRFAAAAVCAFIALGKVLSPQFLIWLIPLVPLVRGRRGLAASALLALACVLTQLWFPFRYFQLTLGFKPLVSWLVFARDLTLVAIVAVLAWPDGDAPSS
jgi:hypothetical protein